MPDFSRSIDKAHQLLTHSERYPGLKIRNKSDRSLLIWSYPAYANYCSWSVFIERNAIEQKTCFVRRIKWIQSFSYKKTESYTLGCEAIIDFQQATKIIDRFSQHRDWICSWLKSISNHGQIKLLSLDSLNTIGIDGTIYGIEITDRRIDRCFSWWSIPPEDWQPLLIWFQDTIAIFDAILPKNNISQ